MRRPLYHFGSRRSAFVPYLLMAPGLFLYLLVALGPSLATFVYSFTDATGLVGTPTHWIGLANFREFLLLGDYSRDNLAILLRTLEFSLFVTVVQTVALLLVRLGSDPPEVTVAVLQRVNAEIGGQRLVTKGCSMEAKALKSEAKNTWLIEGREAS